MSETTYTYKPIKRLEDARLLRGQSVYMDDLPLENALHMKVVRSSQAHARISSIDISTAKTMLGVIAVFTADDLEELYVTGDEIESSNAAYHPVLAKETVRYVGQPVAVVLAETKLAAEDAAYEVMVSYEDLEAVTNPFDAVENKTLLHPELKTNIAYTKTLSVGDAKSAFAKAHKIVGERIHNQRVAPQPMETRGVAAKFDGEMVTLWSSTQGAHDLRDDVVAALGIEKDKLRVITPDVGGGFGAKITGYAEDVLVAHLAKKLQRPIKWIESRSENLLSMTHGRDQMAELELACDEEARVIGMRGRISADLGAYLLKFTAETAPGTLPMLQGPYHYLEHFDIELVEVYTNKTPTSAYRGAGRPEATFFLERLMNLVALEFNLDPAEVRKKNLIPANAFPYKTQAGAEYDSGDYHMALEKLLETAKYTELRQKQIEARKQGRYLGIGLSSYVECCAYGKERAIVRVNQDGTATVLTGVSPHGQGGATSFAQIVAEELGIIPEQVEIIYGDTKRVRTGQGTSGSRTLVVGGSAILEAAQKVRAKLLNLAAHVLEASVSDLELSQGSINVKGVPTKRVTVKELANVADSSDLPNELQGRLEETGKYSVGMATSPFGSHLCVVEVNVNTGEVEIIEYICIDDCGTTMNPLLVEGQVHGGIAQAIGQALYEQVNYDNYGQNLSSSLMDYVLPRASLVPSYQTHRTVTPSPTNPLGVKGVGEAGTIGGTPAVVNAVLDALSPFDIKHLDMPLWPQKIWQAVTAKKHA
jgi:aerobic carbon-monoxide dehydrogenase large subunit